MRKLKRGVRDQDVVRWQTFLNGLATNPTVGVRFPHLRPDGIFGKNTQWATEIFQRRYGLKPDGVVGQRTVTAATALGFVEGRAGTPAGPSAPPPSAPPVQPPPIQPPAPGPVQPPPPGPAVGNSRTDSFQRLRAEGWKNDGRVKAGLIAAKAVAQSVEDGSGSFVYDEYRIEVEAMPKDLTPEAFLLEMARDLNGTLDDLTFNAINRFNRQRGGNPTVGELIGIDILGPDNGAVILADLQPNYFIFQTIDSDIMGSHPENGSREFGFERRNNVVVFYTRGCSRPGNIIIRVVGSVPQSVGWTRLCLAIAEQMTKRGGRASANRFQSMKENRGN